MNKNKVEMEGVIEKNGNVALYFCIMIIFYKNSSAKKKNSAIIFSHVDPHVIPNLLLLNTKVYL